MNIEPVTQKQLDSLIRAEGHLAASIVGLYQIDLSKGRGVLEGDDRCLWTHDRCRVTIAAPRNGAGFMLSLAKDPDPECPV